MRFSHAQHTFAVHAVVDHQQFSSLRQSRGYHRFNGEGPRATDWYGGVIAWSKSAEKFCSYNDQKVGKLLFAVTQIATQHGMMQKMTDVNRAEVKENRHYHKKTNVKS